MQGAATSHPQTPPSVESRPRRRFNWLAVLKTSLICGLVFLLLPLGSPWAAMSINSGAVMGRSTTIDGTGFDPVRIVLHFAVAFAYAAIVALATKDPRSLARHSAWRRGGTGTLSHQSCNRDLCGSAIYRLRSAGRFHPYRLRSFCRCLL